MLLSLLDIELNLLILLCFVNGRQMSLKNMHYHLKQVQMQDINVLFLLLVSNVVLALTNNNNNNIEVKTILITKREEVQAIPVAVQIMHCLLKVDMLHVKSNLKKYCLQLELSSI